MNAALETLSAAFTAAYPTVTDYSSALKLAKVQVTLYTATHSLDSEDDEYSRLLNALFNQDISDSDGTGTGAGAGGLWRKVFSVAVVFCRYMAGEGQRRFVQDYSTQLARALCVQGEVSVSVSVDGYGEDTSNAVSTSEYVGFHAFVITELCHVLECSKGSASASDSDSDSDSDQDELKVLFETLFNSLCSIQYDSLQSVTGAVTSLRQSNLFHILHQVMTSPQAPSVWNFLLSSEFKLLDKLVEVVLNTPTSVLKSKVVKLLFSSVSEEIQTKCASSPAMGLNFVLQSWSLLVEPLVLLNDLFSASIVACCLVEIIVLLPPPTAFYPELGKGLWNFMRLCLTNSNAVVRRRGAHLMQKIVVHSKACAAGSLPVAVPSENAKRPQQGRKKTKEELKADKLKRKMKKEKYSEAEESNVPSFFEGKTAVGADTWPLLYLDVYQQMEGCMSMHLLSQVWTQLSELMALSQTDCNSSSIDNVSSKDLFSPPPLSFSWMKVLLNCCLQSQMAPIKKLIMHEILVGKLSLPIEEESVEWFCNEFLAVVDSPALFTTAFEELLVEKKWQHSTGFSKDENDVVDVSSEAWQEEADLGQRNPGILIAVFMGKWVCELSTPAPNSLSLLYRFLERLFCRVSACNSSQAVKWILRCFSFPVVQAALIDKESRQGIFKITTSTLLDIRTLVKEKMLCANIIIRKQIYDGLVNFVLRCCYNDNTSSEADANLKLKLFLELQESFGIRETLLITEDGWTHLSRSLRDCVTNISSASFSDLTPAQIALIFGLISRSDGANGTNCVPESQVTKMFHIATQLYTSPYVDLDKQQHVIAFVQSSVSFLYKICVVDSVNDVDNVASGGRWLRGQNYSGGAPIMLRELGLCGGATAEFSSFLVKSALNLLEDTESGRPAHGGSKVGEIGHFSDFNNHLEMLSELLQLSFTCTGEFSVEISSKIFSTIFDLLKHLTTTLNRLLISRESNDIHPVSTMVIVCVLSKLLQAIHKLQMIYQHMQPSTSSTRRSVFNVFEHQIGDRQYAEVVKNAIMAVSMSGAVSQASFQACVLSLKCQNLAVGSLPTKEFSFTDSVVEEYPLYGRYNDALLHGSWTALSAGLKLLQQCEAKQESDVAIKTILELLEHAIDHLSVAAASTVSYIFDSCRLLVLRALELLAAEDLIHREQLSVVVGRVVQGAWTAAMSDEDIDFVSIQAFILFAFDAATLHILDTSIQQEYFEAVVKVGMANRPHVVQTALLQLCTVWKSDPSLAVPFFNYFSSLLLYREPILDDHNSVDGASANVDEKSLTETIFTVTESSKVLGIDKFHNRQITRALLLDFLECQNKVLDSCNSTDVKNCIDKLIEELVFKNDQAIYKSPAMIGTELFGEKLRCWQTLCILSKNIDESIWLKISKVCFDTLTTPCAHGIRVHLEIFFAAMAAKFPEVILPQILDKLLVFNHSQQALSSYFVIIGHLTLNLQSSHSKEVLRLYNERIVSTLLPWATCSPGLPRAVAQLLAYRLIPTLTSSSQTTSMDVTMLNEIWRFLEENSDIHKMCVKQMSFFETYDLTSKCTVEGLLSIYSDEWGERIPPHILNILLKTVRDSDEGTESNVGGSKFATSINRKSHFESGSLDDIVDDASAFQLQTKITPFDNLQLAIESSTLTRQNTATDRPRQDLIVVASLIDKVTNLAGIARTCEIFAAQELVLSDLSVVKSHDFQSISVASAGWMPMREVAYKTNQSREMICYLREMKSKGYQIVGIEQTGVSVGLSNSTPLSSRCLIVLGKEKEGIPVELLQEMDLCIEIPQYGLTRSLNVHVSAALVIWEATKRNMKLE